MSITVTVSGNSMREIFGQFGVALNIGDIGPVPQPASPPPPPPPPPPVAAVADPPKPGRPRKAAPATAPGPAVDQGSASAETAPPVTIDEVSTKAKELVALGGMDKVRALLGDARFARDVDGVKKAPDKIRDIPEALWRLFHDETVKLIDAAKAAAKAAEVTA